MKLPARIIWFILWAVCVAEVKPCDFPQIKHGLLYNEERYKPYFPVPIGNQYDYYCDNGFVATPVSHFGKIQCTAEGWVPKVPCQKKCVFNSLENGRSPYWERSYIQDESAHVACYPGYSLPNGQNTITCTEDGWSPPPKCVPIGTDCDELPTFDNAIPIEQKKNSYRSGEQVTYRCAASYQLDGSDIVTCVNGKWMGKPVCKVSTGKCGPPPLIDNGDIASFPLPAYPPASSVEYQCQSLYQLQGSKTITCRNGEWSEPPKCLNPCTVAEEIMDKHNIRLKWIERQKLYVQSGEMIEFVCKHGYYHDRKSNPLRTQCIDGQIKYPICKK